MTINTKYMPLYQLQQQLWDKLTLAPMAGGKVIFWKDTDRYGTRKNVYVQTANPPDYDYVAFGSEITLSAIGTFDDGNGNNFIPYLCPYALDDEGIPTNTIELYFVEVINAQGVPQFTCTGVYPPAVGGIAPTPAGGELINFITNGQFVINNGTQTISDLVTPVAYGGWEFVRATNSSTDVVSFPRFDNPIDSPTGNPRNSCRVVCSSPHAGDTYKYLRAKYQDVNRFSDFADPSSQRLTIYFEAMSTDNSTIHVDLYKNYGTGGSPSSPETVTISDEPKALDATWSAYTFSFEFGSNEGKTLGTNDDDYFAICVANPPTSTCYIEVDNFCLYYGTPTVVQYPSQPDSYTDQQISTINQQIPTMFNYIDIVYFKTSRTYTPSTSVQACVVECIGGGGAGGGSLTASGSGGGGGAGGYSRQYFTKEELEGSISVIVGSGGSFNGASGTQTSFGDLLLAGGGGGGSFDSVKGVGGAGGLCMYGTSQSGGDSYYPPYSPLLYFGGAGGSSSFGSGGAMQISTGRITGYNASGYGAGGGGGSGAVPNGGSGSPGFVIITEYLNI